MYIRFVVNSLDEDSGRRQGLFQLSSTLREAGELAHDEEDQLLEIRGWFNEHLGKPESFTTSSKPHALGVALSWFKDTAKEHIAKMYAISSIIEMHGFHVDILRTNRPGYIVYEDEYQITAEPYADTPT
jgi:hypothetical protein